MASGDARVFAINGTSRLVLTEGDITKWQGDAIVNAANEPMLGGGGVDGAIHRAAGPSLLKACKAVPEVHRGVRCPTGEARITPGFNLKAKHVIHTVGPIYQSAAESSPLLASAYIESLKLADQHGLKTIAFPAISTGVYGYPIPAAAEVSLRAVQQAVGSLQEVHFVLFGKPTYNAYLDQATKLFGPQLTPAEVAAAKAAAAGMAQTPEEGPAAAAAAVASLKGREEQQALAGARKEKAGEAGGGKGEEGAGKERGQCAAPGQCDAA